MDPRAEGTNDLLRQGATLCADAEHVASALAPLIGSEPPTFLGQRRSRSMTWLGNQACRSAPCAKPCSNWSCPAVLSGTAAMRCR